MSKCYLALVSGTVPQTDAGMVDAPLLKLQQPDRPARSMIAPPDTEDAQVRSDALVYSVSGSGDHALIEARPDNWADAPDPCCILADIGLPILGDTLYGGGVANCAASDATCRRIIELPHPGT